jgi:hypothetical protein
MRRTLLALSALALLAFAIPVLAGSDAKGKTEAAKAEAKAAVNKTVHGEVIDTGCYLAHEAKGEKHIGCATKCIAGGMPMGLLTAEGTLYLLTMNHDNADPYNKLKDMAGKMVNVTGPVLERSGMKGIEVIEFKPVAAALAPAGSK